MLSRPDPADDERADLLADFCALLIDALQVPEVVAAMRSALDDEPPTSMPPPPSVRAAGPATARGRRR
jgi:hypothetical protein